jgi:aldehyde:ferredoxin oxidoreductase
MDMIRINMTERTTTREPMPEQYAHFGGRALTSRIIADLVPPSCHALGPHNKIVVANGLLAGTTAPNSGRISVGTKSPLTGGIKESNVGANAGLYLARLGIRALVFEGMPRQPGLWLLVVDANGARIEDASQYRGLGTYDTAEKLLAAYGQKASCLIIGPAGEQKMAASAIMATDMDGRPSRAAGRGGTGAVLGSKGIKAIVVPQAKGELPQYHDPETFKSIAREFSQKLIKEKEMLRVFGTAGMVKAANMVQGMPTRNYSLGSFDRADAINGQALHDTIKKRGGNVSRPCHTGCVISCSNIYVDEAGEYITSSLEYETMVMVGPNLDIGDLDSLARIDRALDDVGLDSIETGAAMGVAMEAGLLPWGDTDAVLSALDEVSSGTVLGKLVGSGAAVMGKVLGVRRVPQVKGQSMVAYDPRTFKGMGCAYATSPMGADHTAAPAIPGRPGLDPSKKFELTEKENQVELTRDLQIMITVCDSLGYCFFVGPDIENMRRSALLLTALTGRRTSYEDILDLGVSTLNIEKAFNRAAGIGPDQDRLPEHFYDEPLPPHNRTFDITPEETADLCYDLK